ncbi:BTA121 domain-containing protein surface lipoprotein [Borrelia turicatae]|uniref:BTA121 domain-containing protein surface lipoprotein n=1 Tax=Borrelia turicatae TaxID=142 RepID=UPI002ED5B431
MVKIKCFSLLLILILLLLLFISCDSGIKAGTNTKTEVKPGAGLDAGVRPGAGLDAVVKPGAGLDAVVKPGAGLEAVVKPGAGLEAGAGLGAGGAGLGAGGAGLGAGEAGLGAGEAGLGAGEAGLEAGEAGLEAGEAGLEAGEAGLEAGLEAGEAGLEAGEAGLDDIKSPRLKALLDDFNVSIEGKKAIGYIRKIFIDKNNDIEDKLYKHLNSLEADVVIAKIIKPTVSLLRARGEALRVIQDPTNESIKSRLQDVYDRYDALVKREFKRYFVGRFGLIDSVVDTVTSCTSKFRKFKEMVKSPRVMDVYGWLDVDEQATINEIEKIVIDGGTYDKDKFNKKLNSIDDFNIFELIQACKKVLIEKKAADEAINGVSDDAEKQRLRNNFNELKGMYYSHIRDAFALSIDELCYAIEHYHNNYYADFYGIRVKI